MSKFWQKKYISKYTGAEIDAAVAKAGDATKVEANPTLAGTEAALTGLEVGETKYKVDQPIKNVYSQINVAFTDGDDETGNIYILVAKKAGHIVTLDEVKSLLEVNGAYYNTNLTGVKIDGMITEGGSIFIVGVCHLLVGYTIIGIDVTTWNVVYKGFSNSDFTFTEVDISI